MLHIGVIADTHGKVLPEVYAALAGVSLILHAGNIGGEAVIAELEDDRARRRRTRQYGSRSISAALSGYPAHDAGGSGYFPLP